MTRSSESSTRRNAGQAVVECIGKAYAESLREPAGALAHRFIDPGAGYRDLLWDWDAHFCAMGLLQWADNVGPFVRGCVLNFLDHVRPDGSVPYCLNARAEKAADDRPRGADNPANTIKPLLGQMALMAGEYLGDRGWIAGCYDKLCRYLQHWQDTQRCELGLFVFRSHRGSGADNHPGVYGRPLNSSADVFLNSLMVREFGAMAEIARQAGSPDDAGRWQRRQAELAGAMQQMWDPIDGMFYNLDVQRHPIRNTNQPIDWVVPLKFRSWTGFAPLWAGVASDAQAERLVREHLASREEFRSGRGLRSLAANEPAYCTFAGSNPSNWQGPIWVVSNYIAWEGLRRYGYEEIAAELAEDLLETLARDIEDNGCLHEYYHPESGEGLTHPGFVNWNTLAVRMADSVGGT